MTRKMKISHAKIKVYRSTESFAIKQSKQAVKVEETCRKVGISKPTWEAFAGM
jgi:hypothetical protein